MTAFEAFKPTAAMIRKSLKRGGYTRPAVPKIRDEHYWRELDAYTKAIFEAGVRGRKSGI